MVPGSRGRDELRSAGCCTARDRPLGTVEVHVSYSLFQGFPEITGILGVPIIRMIIYWGLFRG